MRTAHQSLALFILFIVGLTPALAQAPFPQVKEDVIGELQASSKFHYLGAYVGDPATFGFLASPGAKQVVWVEKTGKKVNLVKDGKIQGEYDDVSNVLVSADGTHVAAIVATTKEGKRNAPILLLDGKEIPVSGRIEVFTLTPKGGLFHSEKRDKQRFAFLNGKQLWEFDGEPWRARFSPRGDHLAILASKKGKYFWIVDGQSGPEFDIIGPISFSDDGLHYAYGGSDDTGFVKSRGVGAIVVDGKRGPAIPAAPYTNLFSDILAQRNTTLVKGFVELSPMMHGVGNPVFSHDGKHLAYAATRDKKDIVVMLDDVAGPVFGDILSTPLFSEDGQHLWYVAASGKSIVEVKDQKTIRDFENRTTNIFDGGMTSPDSARLAYIVGKGGRAFFNFGGGNGVQPTGGVPAQRWVVLDGKEGESKNCQLLSNLRFSPDGKHVAWEVHGFAPGTTRRMASVVYIDGKPGKEYDQVLFGSLDFVDNNTAVYAVREDRKALKVTTTLD